MTGRAIFLAILMVSAVCLRGYIGGLFIRPLTEQIANPKIPADFPNDVPVYPNYRLERTHKIAGATMLDLTAKSDSQTVLAFYQQQLAAYGWQVSSAANEDSDDGNGLGITAAKDGREVVVLLTPIKGGETSVRQLVRQTARPSSGSFRIVQPILS